MLYYIYGLDDKFNKRYNRDFFIRNQKRIIYYTSTLNLLRNDLPSPVSLYEYNTNIHAF